jgi:hypothetical protein
LLKIKNSARNGGGRIKENDEGVNARMIYLTHCKDFCKCYSVPLPSTIKKRIEEERKKINSVYLIIHHYSSIIRYLKYKNFFDTFEVIEVIITHASLS